MKRDKVLGAAMLAMAGLGLTSNNKGTIFVDDDALPFDPSVRSKARKKCLLPECQQTTSHNGGYCSAAHCKLHREQMKQSKT